MKNCLAEINAGICVPYNSDAFSGPVPFDILLRSFDDVTVVANPSWLSIPNLVLLVGLLLAVLVAVGARAWFLERRVRRQIATSAYVERRRSHILEDINNGRPLAGVIEQIAELVSFKLKGAPCWCQVADGAQLGNCPPNSPLSASFRRIFRRAPGPPSGQSLPRSIRSPSHRLSSPRPCT